MEKKIKRKADHWEEHSFDEEGGKDLVSSRSDISEVKSILKSQRTLGSNKKKVKLNKHKNELVNERRFTKDKKMLGWHLMKEDTCKFY
jgi:hypothetical protein